MKCPVCPEALKYEALPRGGFWRCSTHGELFPISTLKTYPKLAPFILAIRDALNQNIISSIDEPLGCPNCKRKMRKGRLTQFNNLVIDQCVSCRFVWFDLGELNQVPSKGELEANFPRTELSAAELSSEKPRKIKWPSNQDKGMVRAEEFNVLSLVTGIAEEDLSQTRATPVATSLIILANIALYLKTHRNLDAYQEYFFHPEGNILLQIKTAFTGMFIHAGFGHLFGNMLLLWIVGDNVEDVLGSLRYVLLFIAGGIVGSPLSALSQNPVLSIGASGGVTTILVYYALTFPNNRFHITRLISFQAYTFSVSAWVFVLGSVGLDAILSYFQWFGAGGGVNFLAHLGGAITGVLGYIALQKNAKFNTSL